MSHAEQSRLLDEESAEFANELQDLLSVLQGGAQPSPTIRDDSLPTKQGTLYKRRRTGEWVKFYFRLFGTTLCYYDHENFLHIPIANPRRMISVTYISIEKLQQEDDLLEKTQLQTPATSRLDLYSSSRIYRLSAETDSENDLWHISIQSNLKAALTPVQWDAKVAAFEKISPLLVVERKRETEAYHQLVAILANVGFLKFEKPILQGHLELLSENHGTGWQKTYWILEGHMLKYYNGSATVDQIPEGLITVGKHLCVRVIPPDATQAQSEEQPALFELRTPLRTYTLRTKHSAQMEEWIMAIRKTLGLEPDTQQLSALTENLHVDDSTTDVDPSFIKTLYIPSEKRTVKFANSNMSCSIGRASSNDCILDDKRASRQHCSIEVVGAKVLLKDLGSEHGTKVNGVKVIHKNLVDGDEITVGTTALVFHANPQVGFLSKIKGALHVP
jgi:hypothetical protein